MSDERIEFPGQSPKKPVRLGSRQTIDCETGEVVEERRNAFTMLPPPEGTCPECAVDHEHDQPHNQQSLYYQMQFHAKHGRWPTWTDAMAHCPPRTRASWRIQLVVQLKKHGMPIPDDLKGGEGAAMEHPRP